MNILKRENRTGDKIMSYYDFERGAGSVLLPEFLFIKSRKIKSKEIITKSLLL